MTLKSIKMTNKISLKTNKKDLKLLKININAIKITKFCVNFTAWQYSTYLFLSTIVDPKEILPYSALFQ